MGRTSIKAYLKTKGNVEYRNCDICYYTYNLEDNPDKFSINVNVHLNCVANKPIRTLALDDDFSSDKAAIKYGIDSAKKYIDDFYQNDMMGNIKTSGKK